MTRRNMAYIERVTDGNSVERIYGYDTSTGAKYLLNLDEVVRKYKEKGIKRFERCV